MTVLVFGSINMDLVAQTPILPKPGETVMGRRFETVPGGKGANQAVAVAQLQVPTAMIGRVGNDAFGQVLLTGLQQSGVNCDRIQTDASTHSGVAMIAVDDASENHIIVVPGANGQVDESDVAALVALLPSASVLLLQLEIPLAAVVAAAQAAQNMGVQVILDPAPARSDLPDSLYRSITIITPNQLEASQLVGFEVTNWQTAAQAAAVLQQRGVAIVLIKLGAAGVLCRTATEEFQVPAFPVTAVDTVAAGDAFNGGLAAGLATGLSLREALRQAAAVAALCVTRPGAQPSLPTKAELDCFLDQAMG